MTLLTDELYHHDFFRLQMYKPNKEDSDNGQLDMELKTMLSLKIIILNSCIFVCLDNLRQRFEKGR